MITTSIGAVCEVEARRNDVRRRRANGIDYIDVDERDQRHLTVHLFGKVPRGIHVSNIRIDGGRRLKNLVATKITLQPPGEDNEDDCLLIELNGPGDFSTYTLSFVEVLEGRPTNQHWHDFDPRYAQIDFTFKVGCPNDLDCRTDAVCAPQERAAPVLSYLAKDYASFRQLILDRLSVIMPGWQERHVPDLGVAVVELLAYMGDQLSYYQDAVATEAYLKTSRLRISVRRHARLVDYRMHEGCNARAWIAIWTDTDVVDDRLKLSELVFTTNDPALREYYQPMRTGADTSLKLYIAQNIINIYTWGNKRCCLSKTARRATLLDTWVVPPKSREPAPVAAPGVMVSAKEPEHDRATPKAVENPAPAPQPLGRALAQLKIGAFLLFEEVIGPESGLPADSNPSHRHVVRLTRVTFSEDPLYRQRLEGWDKEEATPVVEIEWAEEDALPFDLCLSTRRPAPDCTFLEHIAVARGNIILVDHGRCVEDDASTVEVDSLDGECACEGSLVEMIQVAKPFTMTLNQGPLTYREPLRQARSASDLFFQDVRKALPVISVNSVSASCGHKINSETEGVVMPEPSNSVPWTAKWDLLESTGDDFDFVVEIDNDARPHLRFGDGQRGRRPLAGHVFKPCYRIGNGPAGNVGADTIVRVVNHRALDTMLPGLRPRNPLPARGGTAPEPIAEVKLFAPTAFRKQLMRAVTPSDYARLAERNPQLQRAGASLRWNGSWYVVRVAVDPLGKDTAELTLLNGIKHSLYRYRRIGHDLEVVLASYVPLEIELNICVKPHFQRGHVEAAVLARLSNRALPDGGRGYFHPDNLTFGTDIFLSQIIAKVQAIAGVESVQANIFQRLGLGDRGELRDGVLHLGPLEVAQLDNDANFPEHGVLRLILGGGR